MDPLQAAKRTVQRYQADLAASPPEALPAVLARHTTTDYRWRGSYPFREINTVTAAAEAFWQPLAGSFTRLQRREDIFIAGQNLYGEPGEIWVMSMGHFVGLFDVPFLGIQPTGRLAHLRYAEFSRIDADCIAETGLFVDLVGLMQQAGCNPLPPATGVHFVYPGPRDHDGLCLKPQPAAESEKTLAVLDRMVEDLRALNESGSMTCAPEVLERSWTEDMIWYGPAGIGATYTIPRYQQQHQLPFRSQLTDKQFVGHVCRFAEGKFACFFGWPNLSNTPIGGWMGLPGGRVNAQMQVVDVYRREGDKLSENWVIIDLPWWLEQQGLDVLARNRELQFPRA
ncbi:MAG: nuclear transport factor 2 family protein [Pseudomonadota bacterium]